MMNNEMLPENPRSYIGVPFCHQGRLRETGLDCIGFLLSDWHDRGWEPLSPETTEVLAYSRVPDGVILKKYLELEADEVPWGEKQQGDIVLMRYGREPQHVGMLLSRPDGGVNIIHSVSGKGVIEHIYDTSFRRGLVGVYRLKEAA